ncbi:cell division protein FtsZ [Saccharibacter floricola]|uniref:Cell division protein FtsZ n=1 Tax=Saccharibacter floricola DSM 15669 TaxID=1123227 RepID=A0ABQ0NVT7_9PROT|nr:cell division protein FtsZ [Saccharibacter floricola]GBQ04505.1 cell division protein FtsZ [Saccharibacter floricola DSM 15669]
MTLNLTPTTPGVSAVSPPRITVIGVGGGGGNAVDNMISTDLKNVEFIVANTDAQQLGNSKAPTRLQLGPSLTRGLGAGAKPEIGRQSAEEVEEEIRQHLSGVDLVFVTAGMGGGTGTGAAPVMARIARENGALTIGVVSKPFQFEGARRCRAADAGIAELQKHVDTLIVIPNQNLFSCATQTTTLIDAFKMADDVLYRGVRSVTDLMIVPGLINLDFADVKTVMGEMGKAMMGTGISSSEADGQDWAITAAERAISNPLLEETSIRGARGLLINVTGGPDLGLHDYTNIMERIREEAHEDAEIIGGLLTRDDMTGSIQVSVVATGIDSLTPQHELASSPDDSTVSVPEPATDAAPTPGVEQSASVEPQNEETSPQPKEEPARHETPHLHKQEEKPAPSPQPSTSTQTQPAQERSEEQRGGGLFSRFFRTRPATPQPQRVAPSLEEGHRPKEGNAQGETASSSHPHDGPSYDQQDSADLDIPAYLRRPQ